MGGLPTSTVNGFAVHPANPKVMYVAMRDGIFRTDNAGQSWTRADGPNNTTAVAVNSKKPDELYAATTEGVMFRSIDGGVTWEQDPFEAMNALRAAAPAPAPDIAFVALDGRPVRLRDFTGRPVVLTFFTTW